MNDLEMVDGLNNSDARKRQQRPIARWNQAAVHSAGIDACRSPVFIGGGQTFKFLFDAPPRKPLLWACLLDGASRDLYPVRLWFARAHIPHPICSGRDTGLSRRTNRNLALISQSETFPSFFSPLSLSLSLPPSFVLLFYPPPPLILPLSTSSDIIMEALCRCSSSSSWSKKETR